MKKVADLLTQTRSALAETNDALDMLSASVTDELVLSIAEPLIKAQGQLQRAERLLAREVEVKLRIEAAKVARHA